MEEKSKTLNNVIDKGEESVTNEEITDKEKAVDSVTDFKATDEDANLMWELSSGKDTAEGDSVFVCASEASEKGDVIEATDDEDGEFDTTLEDKYEGNGHRDGIMYSPNYTYTSDNSTEMLNDPLNIDCEASNKNGGTAILTKGIKKEGPTLVPIVFDATDMDKDYITLKLNNTSPMGEIKKLFPKHLGTNEDTFMLHFNDREVGRQTPLELFSNNLDGEDNVIKIVKSIRIKFEGHLNEKLKGRYIDERPNTPFSVIRRYIAAHLKEPQALIGLTYNDKEILNEQTPESVDMRHGDFLKVIKKEKMSIRFMGSVFNKFDRGKRAEIDPNDTTMKDLKSLISRYVGKDESKIMLTFKGEERSDEDTPATLGMSDTDILWANLEFGVSIKIRGPNGVYQEFYFAKRPLKLLLQTYSQLGNSRSEEAKSFVYRFDGRIVSDGDTAKGLDMVDGDCITACEEVTQVFTGKLFKRGFERLTFDTQREFIDIKKHFGDQFGVDYKDIVLKIDEQRVRDDDTLESLDNCSGEKVITLSIEQRIQVRVKYLCLGEDPRILASKMRPGMPMEEWKSQMSWELEEPVDYLRFMWEGSNITDLDTPEGMGIQNEDTITVHSRSVIKVQVENDGKFIEDQLIHVQNDFSTLAKSYSETFHVGLNSVRMKFRARDVDIYGHCASEIGLMENGIIQVFHHREDNTMTVEFYVEDLSLISVYPGLSELPLLWDVCTEDQIFLLKVDFLSDLFGPQIIPSWILLYFRNKEINDDETLQGIGFTKDDKICIGLSEPNNDEKDVTVYVRRNMKETKSNMGNGQQMYDEEKCAFKLDLSKPLSEFIKKVKSQISCNSKKDKLFLSFCNEMVDKDLLGKNLNLFPYNNHFKCHAFPNLEAFKKYLETSRREFRRSWQRYADSDSSISSEDYDIPNMMPNYKDSNEGHDIYKRNQGEGILNEDFYFPSTPPNYKQKHGDDEQRLDESKQELKKKVKALQMKVKKMKKKEKTGDIKLAKDIENHKDFENVDDILKFIGEDSTSNISKENNVQVGGPKNREHKGKKKKKTQTSSKKSDKKLDTIDKLQMQDDIGDNKQSQILDDLNKNEKDPKNKLPINAKNRTDLDDDGSKSIEKPQNFENFDEQSEVPDVEKEGRKKSRRNSANNPKDKTNPGIECNTCTFINSHGASLCEVCGNDLQNWQMVGNENKRKPKVESKVEKNPRASKPIPSSLNEKLLRESEPTKTKNKKPLQKSQPKTSHEKLMKKSEPKITSFSQYKKLLQNSEPKPTTSSHHNKLLQKSEPKTTEKLLLKSEQKTKESCIEEYVRDSIYLKKQVSTFCDKDKMQNKDVDLDDVVQARLNQVETKTEIFLDDAKAIEYPKLKETYIDKIIPCKGTESQKDANNRNNWQGSKTQNYRQHDFDGNCKIPEEPENYHPEDLSNPEDDDDDDDEEELDEETRKWCQLMVAARKRKDEQRKRDYIKFRDMESRNQSPQLDQVYYGSNAQMFCEEVTVNRKPIVPQPKGTTAYY